MDSLAAEMKLSDAQRQSKVQKILGPLEITKDLASKVVAVFESELEAGMKEGLEGSSLQMENTYVPELLNGTENGRFLALDLGGTNFRVILLEMKAGKIAKEEVEYYSVQESLRLGEGKDLFDFLASCIYDFVQKQVNYNYSWDLYILYCI